MRYLIDFQNSETDTEENYQRSDDNISDSCPSCSGGEDVLFTSDSDESSSSDEENGFHNVLPLFQDSSLSVSEFNAILLALRQRRNITNIALDSILKLLELCLPEGRQLPKLSYSFEKETERVGASMYQILHMHELPNTFNEKPFVRKSGVQPLSKICKG